MKNTKDDCMRDDSPCFAVNQSRRAFFKTTGATILAAPAILTSRKSAAQVVVPSLPPSPPTTPWQQELPVVGEPLQQTDLFAGPLPPPQKDANTDVGEVGRASHQRWDEFFAAPILQPDEADLYELKVEAITNHVFHPIIHLSWFGTTLVELKAAIPILILRFLHATVVRSSSVCIMSCQRTTVATVQR